jgi:molybdopterin-containing oxidoreductase family membrane subunit
MRAFKWIAGLVWLGLFSLGAYGVFMRVTEGLRPTDLGSYVVWGLWISVDIYFIGLSAGAFLLSSLVYVLRVKSLEPIGKLALFTALVTLLLAMLSAWFDIGHMERFVYVFTRPNFSSLMTWMIWLYCAYFLLLLVELWVAMRADLAIMSLQPGLRGSLGRLLSLGRTDISPEAVEADHRRLRVLGTIGVFLATAFHGGMGALFGTLVARPYWFGPLYPIFFLTGALVSGSALLMAMAAFLWPRRDARWREMLAALARVVAGLLAFDLLLEWAEFSIPFWYGVGGELGLLREVLFGHYWWVFWVFHLILGAVIPLLILVRWPQQPLRVGMAGMLIAAMYMAVRLNIVIPGLVTPAFRGIDQAFSSPRLTFTYVPSMTEWQVSLFVAMLGVALFVMGYRLLPLVARPAQAE